MKKVLSLVLCFVLVAVMALPALAASYTVDSESGNASYENAYGYVFKLDLVNDTNVAEKNVLFTSQPNMGDWWTFVALEKVEGDTYKAVIDAALWKYRPEGFALGENQVILVCHSSSSKPTDAETYPNWENKIALAAVKTGDLITFSGVDFENGTLAEGATATCSQAKTEAAVEWKPFFLSHFDNITVEGAGVVFTDDATNTNHAWRIHVVFAPIAGEANAYEIVDIIDYLQSGADKVTKTPVIPEGGFAYNLNYGNDYPSLNMDGPDYTSPNCNNMIADVLTWKIGDKLMFKNVDLEGKTVPTSTEGTNWYDDAYVCTAQYAAYVPGGETVLVKGDNIVAGKDYVISEQFRQGGQDVNWGYDPDAPIAYPDEGGTLTDGVLDTDVTENVYADAIWAGFSANAPTYKDYGYNFVNFDLGEAKDIYEMAIYLGTSALTAGIGVSNSTVQFFASDDGETWEAVSEEIVPEDDASVHYVKVAAKVNTNARYLQVRFARAGWLFVSEVEVYEAVVGTGSEPEVIVETITVDGDLTDTGWAKDGWVTVTPDNGYWQSVPESETISYKYQLRADDTKLYAAFEIDCAAVEGGNGVGTNVRFWINTDSEATVYTHFYDVYLKDGAVAVNAKYNTAKDANSGANIENSTINAVMTTKDGKTYVEFSVDLAEFNGAEGFNYFVCVSNKVNENVCLYYPAVDAGVKDDGSENRLANLPYNAWAAGKQATVDVEAIQLGEVVVNGGTNDNLGDAGIYAIAALALVALIGTAVVIKKRA